MFVSKNLFNQNLYSYENEKITACFCKYCSCRFL